jgi:hypothetical protein
MVLTDDRPATEIRPAGLRFNVPGIPSIDRGKDLAALGTAMASAMAQKPTLLVNPARLVGAWSDPALSLQLLQGQLAGFAVIPAYGFPLDKIVALDAASFAGALDLPTVDSSAEATLTMASADATAPTQAIKASGAVDTPGEVNIAMGIAVAGGPSGAGTAGYEASGMFQTWSTATRAILPVSWAMMRSGAVAWCDGIAW